MNEPTELTKRKCAICGEDMPTHPYECRNLETAIEKVTVAAVEPTELQKAVEPTGIEAEVCQDIASRQQLGINKYGVTVADNPLTVEEWLQHGYLENLDAAIYQKRAIKACAQFRKESSKRWAESAGQWAAESDNSNAQIDSLKSALKECAEALSHVLEVGEVFDSCPKCKLAKQALSSPLVKQVLES